MINVFTLTNINTKITEGKLSKICISEVYFKLVALRINRYTRSSQFQKGWWPMTQRLVTPDLDRGEASHSRIVYALAKLPWSTCWFL